MDPCSVCEDTEYREQNGEYFCIVCGTKYAGAKTMETEADFNNRNIGLMRIKQKKKSRQKKEVILGRKWHRLELYQIILLHQIDALIELGAHPKLKDVTQRIWMALLASLGKAFCDERKTNLKKQDSKKTAKTPTKGSKAKSQEDYLEDNSYDGEEEDDRSLNDDDYDDDDGDDDEEREKQGDGDKQKRSDRFEHGISLPVTLAVCYIGLMYTNPLTMLSDLIRWVKELRVPFLNAERYLPDDYKKSEHYVRLYKGGKNALSSYKIREDAILIAKRLKLGGFPDISMERLVKKYIIQLSLPYEMHSLCSKLVRDQAMKTVKKRQLKLETLETTSEAVALSYIILLLKMLFGLDDVIERELSSSAKELMELTNHKHSLFVFDDWLKFIKDLRVTTLRNLMNKPNFHEESEQHKASALPRTSRVFAPLHKLYKLTEKGNQSEHGVGNLDNQREERFRNSSIQYMLHPENFVSILDKFNLRDVTVRSILGSFKNQNSMEMDMAGDRSCGISKGRSLCIEHKSACKFGELTPGQQVSSTTETHCYNEVGVTNSISARKSSGNSVKESMNTSIKSANVFLATANEFNASANLSRDSINNPNNKLANDANQSGNDFESADDTQESTNEFEKSNFNPELRSSLRQFLASNMSVTDITDRDKFNDVIQTVQSVGDMLHSNYRSCSMESDCFSNTYDTLMEFCGQMIDIPASAMNTYVMTTEAAIVEKKRQTHKYRVMNKKQ